MLFQLRCVKRDRRSDGGAVADSRIGAGRAETETLWARPGAGIGTGGTCCMIISRYIAKKVYIDVSSMSRGIDPAHVGANRDCGRDVTHIRTAHTSAHE